MTLYPVAIKKIFGKKKLPSVLELRKRVTRILQGISPAPIVKGLTVVIIGKGFSQSGSRSIGKGFL